MAFCCLESAFETAWLCRWSLKVKDRDLVRTCAHECQQHLKNRKKMLCLCRLPADSEAGSDSSVSGANEFGIQRHVQTADARTAAPAEDDDDEVLPLWTFDAEQALPDDLEELSEVLLLRCDLHKWRPHSYI